LAGCRRFSLFLLLAMSVACLPGTLRGQVPPQTPPPSQVRGPAKQEWIVSGRVTKPGGEPVPGASVQIDRGVGKDSVKTLDTNAKGEFRTAFLLEPNSSRKLSLKITATKEDYLDAEETADFDSPGKPARVDLVLREGSEDPYQLSLAALTRNLAPRLRLLPATLGSGAGSKDSGLNVQQLLDGGDPARAVALLQSAVQREPACIQCHVLLGLALLERGSWSGAARGLTQAGLLDASGKARVLEPYLALGVLETWRGHPRRAAVFFLQALDVDPGNPLALQELGRVFVLERNTKVADEYLKRAIKAGASPEAHLLRARALVEGGTPEEAKAEMDAYLGGRKVKDLPMPLRGEWAQLEARLELESKGKTPSVADKPLEQLVREIPELEGLQPAPSQEELPALLRRAGERVKEFFENFPDTASTEEVTQERLRADGKIRSSQRQKFQYLLLSNPDKENLSLEEYRTDPHGERVGLFALGEGFMVTSGFASHSLHFHPAYQPGSLFRHLGHQMVGGRNTYVIAFAQRPETAMTFEAFRVNRVETTVLVQGVVWVDSVNNQIIRMHTDVLRNSNELIRLQRQTTDVRFGEVYLPGRASRLWLPHEVAVMVEWNGKTFRNLHRYSDFREFHVLARQKVR
jgi:Flp pilus assembly protein TadD